MNKKNYECYIHKVTKTFAQLGFKGEDIYRMAKALKELKNRLDNPTIDEEHRLEILEFLQKNIVTDDKYFMDIKEFFKELERLVEYDY